MSKEFSSADWLLSGAEVVQYFLQRDRLDALAQACMIAPVVLRQRLMSPEHIERFTMPALKTILHQIAAYYRQRGLHSASILGGRSKLYKIDLVERVKFFL